MSRSKRNAAAEEYFKRAPNYSAGAIDSLSRATPSDPSDEAGRDLLERVLSVLEASHKFSLPDNGELLGREIPANTIGIARLPYTETVVEFGSPRTPNGRAPTGDEFVSQARCVVCWESHLHGRDGFRAWPVQRDDAADEWELSGVGFFTPYSGEGENVECSILCVPSKVPMLRSLFGDGEAGVAAICGQFSRELRAVYQLCAALTCGNVTTGIVRANREAHAARPGSTLFDYHVLMIDPGKIREPGEARGGTHAAPRTHLRRGHIRRLAWGPRIWVNACVVNPSAIGTVNKDYKIVSADAS